ncbi:MAG: 2-hydroxycarboxylate transporter family protein [Planctomycetes bacterium]|nr:2-hydroxycarboxylate transporter family protein [Planctomycetota bacterium]
MATDPRPNGVTILGLPLGYFLVIFLVIMTGAWSGVIPTNFLTGFVFCLSLGGLLTWIGTRSHTVNMIGGPSLLCLFVPTLLVYFGIMPERTVKFTEVFYTGTMGYIEYFIAALICGSILAMDREILIKAGSRYIVPLALGLVLAFLGGGLIGQITGYGFRGALAYLAIPIMGGGIGAGAIPISQIYGQAQGLTDTGSLLSVLMPAVTLANLFAILFAAILNVLGQKSDRFFPGFSGNGVIMRTGEVFEAREEDKLVGAGYVDLGAGFLMAGALYILGYLISKFLFSSIHPYAWTIMATAALKIFGLLPQQMEKSAEAWYGLISFIGVPTILVCVSLTSIEIPIILEAVSNPAYLLIAFAVTFLAALGAGLGGLVMRMNFVESAITAGLCMANTGGAGDVAVLGAGDRMNLMPFAQISSRIGGAIILLIASLLAPWLVA